MSEIHVIQSIAEIHEQMGISKPKHPLVSVIHLKDTNINPVETEMRMRVDLYQIWLKSGTDCEIGYGRSSYDFREGTLAFVKPGQVQTVNPSELANHTEGCLILFHPDLIRKSALGNNIHDYSFFDYEVNEALHVSDEEKKALMEIVLKIETELSLNLDKHSQKLIVSNIELLLDYSTRYYDRQFYIRSNQNQDQVSKFEQMLRKYYAENQQLISGIPSVKYCGEAMNLSPHYLSDLLRKETGKNAQEHIHTFLIERAKNALLGSNDAVSQIAYDLGFQYPQHFTKLFKTKTGVSPVEYKNLN